MSSGARRIAHAGFIPRKPEGQPTRGKTARNRLRRVDTFLLRYDPGLVQRTTPLFERAYFVDLGYGAEPFTTLESATRLRALHPDLPVLGVEIDLARVEAARPFESDGTRFRVGGFNLPLAAWPNGRPERARVIRAFNVLRQYDEADVVDAWWRLGQYVLPGGLLIEGTSDPLGRVWVANVLRRRPDDVAPWQHEALVFSTNFRLPLDLALFQAVLPKNYIHRVIPGEPIHAFFDAWRQALDATAAHQTWGRRQWFTAAAEQLAQRGFAVNTRRKWLRDGYLIVRLQG